MMKSIWLVSECDGGHNAGWPIRAFATEVEARAWIKAENERRKAANPADKRDLSSYGPSLDVDEVPFGTE